LIGRGDRGWLEDGGGAVAFGVGVAVYRDFREVGEGAGGAVAALAEFEKLRLRIDEFGVRLAGTEGFVGDDVFEERDVRFHAADAELAEGAIHALAGHREIAAHGGELHEHGIIERRDDRTGIARGGVEAHAETGGGAVVEDAAVVRGEVFLRILGGDAALDGEAVARDVFLRRKGDLFVEKCMTLRDEDLGADEVDAGDAFRDRMLDLDARVHLDEEPVVLIHVVEELDGAGVVVADAVGEFHGGVAKLFPDDRIEVHRGGDFDDFLVAALDGAIALVEVDDVAVLVAEDLHLDVLGSLDVAFEENGRVAEGVLRLGAGFREQAGELRWFFNHPHATPAATESRLDDEGETDLVRDRQGHVGIGDRLLGAGQDGDVEFVGERAGGGLVAHVFQKIRRGADEDDALTCAGAGEIRVFREEAVAGVDHRHALGLGEFHDALVVKVGSDRAFRRVELVGFVGLEAVDGKAVFLREDGNGAETELSGGAENPDRDFAAVGGHDFSGFRWACGHDEFIGSWWGSVELNRLF
jgi:hypothetical protein